MRYNSQIINPKGDYMKHNMHSMRGIADGKYREARRLRREMTDSERLLWARLRRNQINGLHFRRQHVISGFIVDFYCIKAKLAVEVDGGIHNLQSQQDTIRDDILNSHGIRVLRVTNDRVVSSINDVILEISKICNQRVNHEGDAQYSTSP
jgi:very-short-patch-repair endonuclease